MVEPYELCPRFEKCCVNACPLHPDYQKLKVLHAAIAADPEQKCKMEKKVRQRLGVSLPWKGMTDNEIAGKKRFDALSPEQKEEKRQRAKLMGEKLWATRRAKQTVLKQELPSTAYKNEANSPSSPLKKGISGETSDIQEQLI